MDTNLCLVPLTFASHFFNASMGEVHVINFSKNYINLRQNEDLLTMPHRVGNEGTIKCQRIHQNRQVYEFVSTFI